MKHDEHQWTQMKCKRLKDNGFDKQIKENVWGVIYNMELIIRTLLPWIFIISDTIDGHHGYQGMSNIIKPFLEVLSFPCM